MSWFVYLLECSNGSIYTGIAVDVAARFAQHQQGRGARYTRSFPPLRILQVLEYANRSSASRAEYRIKQLSAADKRALCAGLLAPPAEPYSAPSLPLVSPGKEMTRT